MRELLEGQTHLQKLKKIRNQNLSKNSDASNPEFIQLDTWRPSKTAQNPNHIRPQSYFLSPHAQIPSCISKCGMNQQKLITLQLSILIRNLQLLYTGSTDTPTNRISFIHIVLETWLNTKINFYIQRCCSDRSDSSDITGRTTMNSTMSAACLQPHSAWSISYVCTSTSQDPQDSTRASASRPSGWR